MKDKRSLEERLLTDYPELLARFEEIAGIVENSQGDLVLADEAERRVIEEVRQLGNEVLQGWARRQSQRSNVNFAEKMKTVQRNGKKNSAGTPPLASLK